MLLDIELAPLTVLVLQHRHPALEDVYTLDPALYHSLMQVLSLPHFHCASKVFRTLAVPREMSNHPLHCA